MVIDIGFIKVTEFEDEAAPTLDDLLMVVEDPDGNPISRRATVGSVLKAGAAFGEIYIALGSAAQTGVALTPVKMTAWNSADGFNGPALNTTPDKANNEIVVANAATYNVALNISMSASPNQTFHFEIRLDGVSTNKFCGRKLASGGDLGDMGINTLLAITAGQAVSVFVNSEAAGGTTFTVMDAQLTVTRAGP